jgi:hypothetical protein
MKKLYFVVLSISILVLGLVFYKNHQSKIHTLINHISNPSPVTWNDALIYYQEELICKKQNDGLLFMAWGGALEGFIGVGSRDSDTAQQSIINIKNSNKYKMMNETETYIDGMKAYTIECINEVTQEYTLFIFVIDRKLMILYSGPQDNLPFFQKTIDAIKFK